MVGSYPGGNSWDMCYCREDEAEKVKKIKDLECFDKDPIYGNEGPAINA